MRRVHENLAIRLASSPACASPTEAADMLPYSWKPGTDLGKAGMPTCGLPEEAPMKAITCLCQADCETRNLTESVYASKKALKPG